MSNYSSTTEELLATIAFSADIIDEADANTTYLGWFENGVVDKALPNCKLQKIVKDGNITSILWAEGESKAKNKIWNLRDSYDYIHKL